jgi:acetoin utilization deacetylase AcuC-like enzyme
MDSGLAGRQGQLMVDGSPERSATIARARFFRSGSHLGHAPATEWSGSGLIPCAETPERVSVIEAALEAAGARLEEVAPADRESLERIHSGRYLDYLETAAREWKASGRELPTESGNYAPRGVPVSEPTSILGRAGYFAFGLGSPILDGTWEAALGAAGCALAATEAVLAGARLAFGLCRPPGHHAATDYGGGYCYLNNAALAADVLARQASRKGGVAVVDLDYHHGNGTQEIFWARDDVTYFSIHADPDVEFPYFTGRAFEQGDGPGLGFTINEPLPLQSGDRPWLEALDRGLASMVPPDYLVVSLGLDAEMGDEQFEVSRDGFSAAGARLASVAPLVVLLEGGYLIDALGPNAMAFLAGALGGKERAD